jgi:actin-related protein
MSELKPSVVIDNGSSAIRAGLSGIESPKVIIPSVVGRPRQHRPDLKDLYIGNDAYSKADVLSLKHPIKRGIIKNWDDIEKIYHHIFYNELRVDPTKYPVLISGPSIIPKIHNEKMTSLMFETFNVPSFYVTCSSLLSLYSSGRATGVILEIGGGITQTLPIFETRMLPFQTKINFAGNDLTESMGDLLYNRGGYTFDTPAEKETLRGIKEKLCYVAHDFDAEVKKAATSSEINRTYRLPNGKAIIVGNERFLCPELLFRPHIQGNGGIEVHKILFDTIMKCDINIRKDLFANIVISGGTTMCEGFADRLNKEITALNKVMNVKIFALPGRKDLAWVGGSIFASLPPFPKMVITKKEFDEEGPQIVHRKCL